MTYPEVDTFIQPPSADEDQEARTSVTVSMVEADGTYRSSWTSLPADADPQQLADALIRCVLGAATMRGPDLSDAVRLRLHRDVPVQRRAADPSRLTPIASGPCVFDLTYGHHEAGNADGWATVEPNGTAAFQCATHELELAGRTDDVVWAAQLHLQRSADGAG